MPFLEHYWLDSGALLGAVRTGQLMAWDSDIDLGIWDDACPALLAAIPHLKRLGWKAETRRYRGKVYGLTFKPRADRSARPIHVHVFYDDGDIAWSPQTVTYYPNQRQAPLTGFADTPRLRQALHGLRSHARKWNKGAPLQRLLRLGLALPAWGTFVIVRNRFERHHWTRLPLVSALYAIYTWTVPAHHFRTLSSIRIGTVDFPIPSAVEDYLTLRYGDWRRPVRDWCYWLDDGCIHPAPPEQVLARLDRQGSLALS